jgi:hypothetical protein
VIVRDLAGMVPPWVLATDGHAHGLAFSPHGVPAVVDTRLRRWDTATRRQIGEAVRFADDGELLVSVGADDTLRFWDPVLGARIGEDLTEAGHRLLAVTFDGDELLVLADDMADRQESGVATVIRVPLGPVRLARMRLRRAAAQGTAGS